MSVVNAKPGYEEVFTVTDYYDGPRQGVANFKSSPHFYDCIFDEAKGDFSDLYKLTPISQDIFELAKEDWSIWEKWESAFYSGNASRESHPALPEDKARHDEIRAVLDSALVTDPAMCVVQHGSFDRLGATELQVKWAEPSV